MLIIIGSLLLVSLPFLVIGKFYAYAEDEEKYNIIIGCVITASVVLIMCGIGALIK